MLFSFIELTLYNQLNYVYIEYTKIYGFWSLQCK